MLVIVSKSDETIMIVQSALMVTPHCPLPRPLQAAANTAAARHLDRLIGVPLTGVERNGVTPAVTGYPGAPPLAWMVAGHHQAYSRIPPRIGAVPFRGCTFIAVRRKSFLLLPRDRRRRFAMLLSLV